MLLIHAIRPSKKTPDDLFIFWIYAWRLIPGEGLFTGDLKNLCASWTYYI